MLGRSPSKAIPLSFNTSGGFRWLELGVRGLLDRMFERCIAATAGRARGSTASVRANRSEKRIMPRGCRRTSISGTSPPGFECATLVLLTSVFRVNGCYPRKPPGLTAGGFLGAIVNIEPSHRGRSADDAVGTKGQVCTPTRANVAGLVFLLVRTHPERGLTNPTCQCRVKVMTDHLRMTPGMTPEQREEVRAARRERDHREAQAAAQHSRDRRARQSDEQNAADDAEKERLRGLFR